MTTYYKAVRPDGTDFYSGTVRWIPEDVAIPAEGWLVVHPTAKTIGPAADEYLSVSTVPTDCTGMEWPCRLLAVEAVGDVSTPNLRQHNKRAAVAWRVRDELSAHEALGPQGAEVAAILDRMTRLTPSEVRVLSAAFPAAREAGRYAAWYSTRKAALNAARFAAWFAASNAALDTTGYDAACNAAIAIITRDLINTELYDQLISHWRDAMGEPT